MRNHFVALILLLFIRVLRDVYLIYNQNVWGQTCLGELGELGTVLGELGTVLNSLKVIEEGSIDAEIIEKNYFNFLRPSLPSFCPL